jgi:hypothetical protein
MLGDPRVIRRLSGSILKAFPSRGVAVERGTGRLIRASVLLFEALLVAIVLALVVTVISVPSSVKVLAAAIVVPILTLGILILVYCKRRRAWSFAGASILGAVGIVLRVAVSTQPKLEVGGGLPYAVSAAYIALGALTSVANLWSFIALRKVSDQSDLPRI